jgi:hypothetical protein
LDRRSTLAICSRRNPAAQIRRRSASSSVVQSRVKGLRVIGLFQIHQPLKHIGRGTVPQSPLRNSRGEADEMTRRFTNMRAPIDHRTAGDALIVWIVLLIAALGGVGTVALIAHTVG